MDIDIQIFYAGDNARAQYSYAAPALTQGAAVLAKRTPRYDWDKASNTLRVLITTAKDLDPTGEYKKHDWSILPACGVNNEKKAIDINTYSGKVEETTHRTLRQAATMGFFAGIDYNNLILNHPGKIAALNSTVTHLTLTQRESAINLGSFIPSVGTSYVVVAMPDEPESATKFSTTLAGLDERFLRVLPLKDKDLSLFKLGHEILGHALHGHRDAEETNSRYSCTHLDYKYTDIVLHHEGFSDAAALAGFSSLPSVPAGIDRNFATYLHALRTLGTFFNNSNTYFVRNSADVETHTSNHHLSLKAGNYISTFNHQARDGISALPLIINTYADAIAGFTFMVERATQVRKTPKRFTPQERDFYRNKQGEFSELDKMVHYGYMVRSGMDATGEETAITASPAYHVAAMNYLKRTGQFDRIKAHLAPALRPAFDTLVADYFASVAANGSTALRNPAVQNRVDAAMRKANLDMTVLSKVLFDQSFDREWRRESRQTRGNLRNYRNEHGLSETVPAFLQHRAP